MKLVTPTTVRHKKICYNITYIISLALVKQQSFNIRDKMACFELKYRLCHLYLQHKIFRLEFSRTRHVDAKNPMIAAHNYFI